MSSPNGWQRFLYESVRSAEGRAAFQAYREQKRLAVAAPAKIALLEELLERCVWPHAQTNIQARLVELKDNCLSEAIDSRPLFDEIAARLLALKGD